MMFLFIFLSLYAWAKEPTHWSHVIEVRERHEFYDNNQPVTTPKESWQTLFSLVFVDENFSLVKDCVFYRVPGTQPGKIKVRSLEGNAKCEDFALEKGEVEVDLIKSLSFSTDAQEVRLEFVKEDNSQEKWQASLEGAFRKPELKLHLSSVEFRSPKLLYLAPLTIQRRSDPPPFLRDGVLCHDVKDDCTEASASTCDQCEHGWFEVPNACAIGPKYCGGELCGKKDRPACRRGMRWQRKESTFDCRTDSSFAYCSKGLSVVCEGQRAYCR